MFIYCRYMYLFAVSESKAVPLLVMEALGGRGGIPPTYS
jgi:hypothetical protein